MKLPDAIRSAIACVEDHISIDPRDQHEVLRLLIAELTRLQEVEQERDSTIAAWPESTSGKTIVGYSSHYRKWITGWCGDPMFESKADAVRFVVARERKGADDGIG